MKGFIIERSTLKDLEILRKISKETFFQTFCHMNTEENMENYLKTSFSYENIKSELENKDSIFFMVRCGEEAAGYMKVNFEKAQTEAGHKNSLEVQRIYILKKHQRMGLGKLLIDKAIEIAEEKNLDYIWLGVWEIHADAIKFYEKQGFEKFGSHTFVMGDEIQRDDLMKMILKGEDKDEKDNK